ncbi:MAG: matrixin family metalloprotease [Myxococcales bacterium]|nr:matrixin family metalloprotease [Myxococcales bacterium]MCB9650497.1 matrixin family metalloprotease [Deltaproteobacteria bacterium]
MSRLSVWSVTALSLGALLGWAGPARAYVCTPVTDGNGVPVSPAVSQVWVNRCIPYFINRDADLFSGGDRQLLVEQSFQVWAGNACTDLEFADLGYTDQQPGFDPRASDNENVITSVKDAASVATYFPEANMVAITITAFSTSSGEIFDADIVVNDLGFDFEDVVSQPSCAAENPAPFDLRAILIHEMGHFIGFDHEADVESTMYFSAPACEVKKRTLTDDDIIGVCTVYPKGQAPKTCAPPSVDYDDVSGVQAFRDQCEAKLDGGSCSCTGYGADAPYGLALAMLALLGLRKRR